MNGLYVGQLSPDELKEFERMVAEGKAIRSYQGVAGMMGVAKVKFIEQGESNDTD